MMNLQEISKVLRRGQDSWLWYRRGIVGTSFIAAACMQAVGLYQMGLIRHLPEPPLPRLNADKVDAAPEAYNRLSLPMPDAFPGLVSYAITASLAALGGADRVERQPWIPLLLGTKVTIDAVQAGKLSWEQWAKHKSFCFWCLVAAGATFTAVPLAMPETFAALKRLPRWLMGK